MSTDVQWERSWGRDAKVSAMLIQHLRRTRAAGATASLPAAGTQHSPLWDMLKTAPAHPPPPLPDFPPQGQRSASYRWGLEGRGLSTLAPPPLGEGVVHLFPRVPLEAWAQAPTGAPCTEPTQRWAFPPTPPRSASWDHLQISRFRGSQRQRQAEVPCPRPPCSAVFRRVLAQPVFL